MGVLTEEELAKSRKRKAALSDKPKEGITSTPLNKASMSASTRVNQVSFPQQQSQTAASSTPSASASPCVRYGVQRRIGVKQGISILVVI